LLKIPVFMKIFTCEQIRQIDSYTIKHEPIASIDLMERAAGKLFAWITEHFKHSDQFIIFAGPGNNGGDGLALGRMLLLQDYNAEIYCVDLKGKESEDRKINRQRLEASGNGILKSISSIEEIPGIAREHIVIDALFGSGLSRPAEGLTKEIITRINQSSATVISIDIPSGLFCENNNNNNREAIVKASYTLTFQFPRLAFMFSENSSYAGDWRILPIGLHPSAISNTPTAFTYLTNKKIYPILKKREKFDHKGVFGHGLLISGSYGKIGAAVLASKAALRTGLGLLTSRIPACGYEIMQSSVHEAMASVDEQEKFISSAINTDDYDAVGIGPGIGMNEKTVTALRTILKECRKPLVLDADALNIISANQDLFELIPEGTVITPHPGEFDRLAGESTSGYERFEKQIQFSSRQKCIVVLKGAYTTVSLPDGSVIFNSTGNPGMATAGSGDVLTGIILSLLAQGYDPGNASVLGAYLHGLAGDIAATESGYESLIASDIINCIGKAFNNIRELSVDH
jgi:NAD(P)H-hydrate epimerase